MIIDALWLLLCVAVSPWASSNTAAPRDVAVTWTYDVVSTPDFQGPFRGNLPGFKAPAEVRVAKPKVTVTTREHVGGILEAIIDTAGTTSVERILAVSPRQAGASIRAVVNRWRFCPAAFDGAPIRVRIRIEVSERPE